MGWGLIRNGIGIGNIYLGAYETKIDATSSLREGKVKLANLYFLRRDNPGVGYLVKVKDAKHKNRRYSGIYKMGQDYARLIQFGISDLGFFTPKPSNERMGLVSFPEEEPTFYGGAGTIDLKMEMKPITWDIDKLKRAVEDYGLDFKDDWAKNGTLQLRGNNV